MSQTLHVAKRRRDGEAEGEFEETIQRRGKRIKALPIRSSPGSKQSTFFSRIYSPTTQPVPALLTPVESSDDDIASNDLNFEPSPLPQLNDSNTNNNSSTSSIKVVILDDGDMEMADAHPRDFSSPRPWQRQRSNDMLEPPNIPHLLETQQRLASERLPTPIYGHFNDSDINMDMNRTGDRPFTLLSPFIREEEEPSWWRGHRLPSPVDTFDEFMNPAIQADGMMDGLNDHTAGSNDALRNETPFPALSNQGHSIPEWRSENFRGEMNTPRSRRLTMGYRADCDKCVRRVPGHYSHIVYD